MGLFCLKFSYATAYFDRNKKLIKQKVFVMENFRNLPKEHRKSKSKFCAIECWKSNVISLPPSKLIRESTVSFPFSGRIRKKSTRQIEEKTWQCFLSGRLVTF